MLRFHDVEQNSEAWLDVRPGNLTGSEVDKVMANYGKAFGEPAKAIAARIACNQLTGKRSKSDSYTNAHMERGHEQEPIAALLYEERYFVTCESGGFFSNGNLGCSPDRLVGEDGLLEIKSVIASTQYKTIKKAGIPSGNKWQCYFNLKLTERKWLDFVSYCADFPEKTQLYIHRIWADECEEVFGMIDKRVSEFFEMVESMKQLMKGE